MTNPTATALAVRPARPGSTGPARAATHVIRAVKRSAQIIRSFRTRLAFTVGVTSAAALLVFAAHGRINLAHAGPIIAGSLLGGQLGARLQARLGSSVIRRTLAAILVGVALVLFVQA